MSIDIACSVAAVTDVDRGAAFYARLLGRPADLTPMPSLAQWDLPSGGVQVVGSVEHAGHSLVTLLVSDFEDVVATLAADGLDLGDVVVGTLSRLTEVHDPDGNVVTVAEIPQEG